VREEHVAALGSGAAARLLGERGHQCDGRLFEGLVTVDVLPQPQRGREICGVHGEAAIGFRGASGIEPMQVVDQALGGIADGEVAVSGMDAIGPAGRLLQVVDRNRDDAVRHFLPRLSSARYNQKLQACATMGR
jgi:hypothetical protein